MLPSLSDRSGSGNWDDERCRIDWEGTSVRRAGVRGIEPRTPVALINVDERRAILGLPGCV